MTGIEKLLNLAGFDFLKEFLLSLKWQKWVIVGPKSVLFSWQALKSGQK